MVGAEVDGHVPAVLRGGCARRREVPLRVRPRCLGAPGVLLGTYLEVTPHARLVWTNEEGGGEAVTTVTFEEKGGKTLLILRELHPSKEACDDAIGFGEGLRETFAQLDELLASLDAIAGS